MVFIQPGANIQLRGKEGSREACTNLSVGLLLALTLAISLGGIVALVDDEILWSVVFLAGEV